MNNCPDHDRVTLSAKEQAAFDSIVRATTFDREQRALSAAIADIRFNPSLHVIDGFQRNARRMWRCAGA
jgi:hypothetical protein